MLKQSRTLCAIVGYSLGATMSIANGMDFPQAKINNGMIHATVCLPDAQKGYYVGTRFDWAGAIASLECQGHSYFGQWFTSFRATILDIEFDPSTRGYAAGVSSASLGPVEEFGVLGYDEAKIGGTFLKIGVGSLRKPEEPRYDHFRRYEIVDAGKWTVRQAPNSIEFAQEVRSAGGYAYVYRKTVRLVSGKPQMVLEHSLKNTGQQVIKTTVLNHNFFVIDKQPTGPDFIMSFPFELKANRPLATDLAILDGKQIKFLKVFEEDDRASTGLVGHTDAPSEYDFRLENHRTGAGVRIVGGQRLQRIGLWAISTTLTLSPVISIQVEPRAESTWSTSYEFYTVPK